MSDNSDVVSLQCKCGSEFERPKEYVTKAKEYAEEFPSAARFYKRKITLCDKCNKAWMDGVLERLPDVLKALSK